MASVRRRGTRVIAALEAEEAQLLRLLATDLKALLAESETDEPKDPLEQLTGMTEGAAPEPPTDPALARLLPDGYRDNPEAAAELRRLTDPDIRQAKQHAASQLLDTLPEDGGRVKLGEDDVVAWTAALNDLRLVLGTRLEVTEETEPFGGLAPDDPAAAPYAVYHWLTGLQDELVNTLL
jgi:hypothetical protein